jgi:hypothetical protein
MNRMRCRRRLKKSGSKSRASLFLDRFLVREESSVSIPASGRVLTVDIVGWRGMGKWKRCEWFWCKRGIFESSDQGHGKIGKLGSTQVEAQIDRINTCRPERSRYCKSQKAPMVRRRGPFLRCCTLLVIHSIDDMV